MTESPTPALPPAQNWFYTDANGCDSEREYGYQYDSTSEAVWNPCIWCPDKHLAVVPSDSGNF